MYKVLQHYVPLDLHRTMD